MADGGDAKTGLARRYRRRERKRPRYHGPSFNMILPNLLTMIGLCSGLTAIRFAIEGHFARAAVAIILAGVIDGLDGRLARLLNATSRFGAEFDSLADFCCFGIAPPLVLYLWSLKDAGRFGYMPCLMFAVCMALRLARFNATLETGPKPAYAQSFFTGVPAPAGALLALFPLFVWLEARDLGWPMMAAIFHHPSVTGAILAGGSALSVSTLPVWSFKNFKVPAKQVGPLVLGMLVLIALFMAEPWLAFALLGAAYMAMLPFSLRSFHRLRHDAEDEAGLLQNNATTPNA
jgi:CDP-diacylglycerol--serine O-phosphatidyltransferase